MLFLVLARRLGSLVQATLRCKSWQAETLPVSKRTVWIGEQFYIKPCIEITLYQHFAHYAPRNKRLCL